MAVIRSGKARVTKQKLDEKGFWAYTEKQVLGRGKQTGLHYSAREGAAHPAGIAFLPKTMLILFVAEETVKEAVETILAANKTGEIGDGKIFISPLEEVVRIRTDERGAESLGQIRKGSSYAPL